MCTKPFDLHFHCVFLEGVYLDHADQGRKPRFVTGEAPSDAAIAAVIHQISRRVIRTLCRLGYLETGIEPPVATGYDPLREHEPALARTMARFMAPLAGDDVPSDTILVPVPLHRWRLWNRGFNQSALVAGALSRRLDPGDPLLPR